MLALNKLTRQAHCFKPLMLGHSPLYTVIVLPAPRDWLLMMKEACNHLLHNEHALYIFMEESTAGTLFLRSLYKSLESKKLGCCPLWRSRHQTSSPLN
mmetsp:Transcript_8595/g.15239  ORF Transcript_8595/g.15239 Transcript_8595/m.15239 type:complete len:98 (+) Transcript_8595:126-419(+)